ncbi:MAG TPA: alpha/beta fold hydrolase [Steroidobacteraceae bacterium]|nr:alpha/beta fold hydrolase [Steroidobacteraceae bacterium]
MSFINYPLAVGSGTTRIIESGQGAAILFVHGLGARADRWVTTIERVGAHGYRAIAFDLPGHGFASKEAEGASTVPDISAYLLGVMDALGLEHAILVGTSLGAHIVAYAATRAPLRVRGLVLVGALGLVPIDGAVAENIRRNVQVRDRDRFAGKLKFVLHDPALVTPALVEEEWRMNTAPGTIDAFIRLGNYLVDGIAADTVAEKIKALFPPERLLLVWGAEDKAVPVSVGEACRDALGVRLVLVPGANHAPYFEQPEAFDAAVLPFLASLPG